MIHKKKLVKNILLMLSMVLIILLVTRFVFNPKKDSMYYAQAFLEKLTTPEEDESTGYYREMLSGDVNPSAMESFGIALESEYKDLMTANGFEKAVANRFIPWDVLALEDDNFVLLVDSYEVIKMDDYKDGSVHYGFLISLRIEYSNGEREAVQVSGDLVMAEENGRWKVEVFRRNPDFTTLYNLIYSPR